MARAYGALVAIAPEKFLPSALDQCAIQLDRTKHDALSDLEVKIFSTPAGKLAEEHYGVELLLDSVFGAGGDVKNAKQSSSLTPIKATGGGGGGGGGKKKDIDIGGGVGGKGKGGASGGGKPPAGG